MDGEQARCFLGATANGGRRRLTAGEHSDQHCSGISRLVKDVGPNLLQFSQNIAAQVGTAEPIGGGDTALATGKGFDQDQIAKLKDVCGVRVGAHIPTIWAVIQASKGKSYDSYRTHIAKAMESWARANHIELDKSIHLDSKFSTTWWRSGLTRGDRWSNINRRHEVCQC